MSTQPIRGDTPRDLEVPAVFASPERSPRGPQDLHSSDSTSHLEVLVQKVKVSSVKRDEGSTFKGAIEIIGKKQGEFSNEVGIHSSVHSVARIVVGTLASEKVFDEGTSAMLSTATKVSSVAFGCLEVITKALGLKGAIEKFIPALKWGTLADKIDTLIALTRSLIGFSSTTGSTAGSIAGVAVSAALAVPLLVLKIASGVMWIITAIVRIIRMSLSLNQISKLLEVGTDKEKLLAVIDLFDKSENKIELENAKILKAHKKDPDLAKYLQDRKSGWLLQEYGPYAEKKIFSKLDGQYLYKHIRDDIQSIDAEKIRLIQDIAHATAKDTGRVTELRDQLRALKLKEDELITQGLKWIGDLQSEISANRAATIPLLIAAATGLLAVILGLILAPYIIIPLSILTTVAWMSLDIIGLIRKHEVTENQKDWMANIVVRNLINQARKAEDPFSFAEQYGFKVNDDQLTMGEFYKGFRAHLKEKFEDKEIRDLLDYSKLSLLKEFHKGVKQEEHFSRSDFKSLESEFNALMDALLVPGSDKAYISKTRHTRQFLESLASDERLAELTADRSFIFRKLHTKIAVIFDTIQASSEEVMERSAVTA